MKSLLIIIFCFLFLLTSCELKNDPKSSNLNVNPDIGISKSLLNDNLIQPEDRTIAPTKETDNQNLENEIHKILENKTNSSNNYTSTKKADAIENQKNTYEKPINDSEILKNELPSKPEEIITNSPPISDDCTVKETIGSSEDKNETEIEEDIIPQPSYVLPANYTNDEGMHFEYYWTETEAHSRFLELWDLRKDCRWHSRYFEDEETEYYELMWED